MAASEPAAGTTKATENPTAVPNVFAVAMTAVAVARSRTGNHNALSTGGASDSIVPARPLASIETNESAS